MAEENKIETADNRLEVAFDLSRITLDELLDIVELAAQEEEALVSEDEEVKKEFERAMKRGLRTVVMVIRKCITWTSRPLNGEDFRSVMREVFKVSLGGAPEQKN